MLEQQRHVRRTLADRWHPKLDDVQAVVKIFAEFAVDDLRAQIAVGCGNQPNVRPAARPIGSNRLNLAGFGEAEQHGLHAKAHLSQFVEEQRAAFGLSDQAGLVAIRARETATDMPEQLGLQECLRYPAAIESDKRPALSWAVSVDQARDDLFAHACLAKNQDFRVTSCRFLDLAADNFHRWGFPE